MDSLDVYLSRFTSQSQVKPCSPKIKIDFLQAKTEMNVLEAQEDSNNYIDLLFSKAKNELDSKNKQSNLMQQSKEIEQIIKSKEQDRMNEVEEAQADLFSIDSKPKPALEVSSTFLNIPKRPKPTLLPTPSAELKLIQDFKSFNTVTRDNGFNFEIASNEAILRGKVPLFSQTKVPNKKNFAFSQHLVKKIKSNLVKKKSKHSESSLSNEILLPSLIEEEKIIKNLELLTSSKVTERELGKAYSSLKENLTNLRNISGSNSKFNNTLKNRIAKADKLKTKLMRDTLKQIDLESEQYSILGETCVTSTAWKSKDKKRVLSATPNVKAKISLLPKLR